MIDKQIFSGSPIYLIMWAYSQEKVCLLLEIVNKSGRSLCPGRIYLSLIELSAAD